jgi:dTDP-glucose 4,6-dehydratase
MGYASDLTSIDHTLLSLGSGKEDRHFFLKVDLSNYSDTISAVNYADPDFIMHLAAESHVDRSIKGPGEFIKSNIVGTFNLLESARKFWSTLNSDDKKNFRFHHISTDEVFGSLEELGSFSEETPYDPRSPYSASKASSDHLVKAWFHTYKLPIVLTNCSNNYGPLQFPEKLIPLVIFKAFQNEKIPIYGDGLNIRDWLFIDDHVDALLLVAEKGIVGESYCIGGNGEKSNKEVVLKICEIMDKKFPLKAPHKNLIEFVKDRPGHDKRYSINPSKIVKNLGWKAKHTFDEGLEETVNWYLDNINWYEKISSKNVYNFQRLGKTSR